MKHTHVTLIVDNGEPLAGVERQAHQAFDTDHIGFTVCNEADLSPGTVTRIPPAQPVPVRPKSGVWRKVLRVEHDLADRVKHSDLFQLPRLRRLCHEKLRRHVIGLGIGLAICCIGSAMALNGATQKCLPHFIWDCASYLVHGAGSIPIMRHVEPLWAVIAAE